MFRKDLLSMLSTEPRSVSRIARELGLKRGDVEDDLRHLVRSARAAGHRITVVPARCRSCGFYLPLAGSLRQAFGACGNIYAPDDGRVVSADHGCGAHSEVLGEQPRTEVEELPTVYDDSEVDAVAVSRGAGSVETGEPAEPYGHG